MFRLQPLPARPPLLDIELRNRLNEQQWIKLSDEQSWHFQFYVEVSSRIEESVFEVLYSQGGRPNSPIYVLVSMLFLKEYLCCSDEALFENCQFNLQVLCALGITLGDDLPSSSTYYEFKSKMARYYEQTGIDLLDECFKELTEEQIRKYGVNGKKVRMDSKLIHSNVAKMRRLQLVLEVVIKFYLSLEESSRADLRATDRAWLKRLASKSASGHLYGLTKQEQKQWLVDLGSLLEVLCELYDESASCFYEALQQVWQSHYEVKAEQVEPKKKEDLSASNIQSVHDLDAHYRKKNSGQKVQKVIGYSCNITEACEQEDAPNLITDAQTQGASTPDTEFFQPALERTEQATGQSVEEAWTDGSYHSTENLEQIKAQGKQWHIPNIQGAKSNYEFEHLPNGSIEVTDKSKGEKQIAIKIESGKYRIEYESDNRNKRRYRYFSQSQIDNYEYRQQIENKPKQIYAVRANVEATIQQVFHPLNGNKTKYRGRLRNHWFVLGRVVATNLNRIMSFAARKAKKARQNELKSNKNRVLEQIYAFYRMCCTTLCYDTEMPSPPILG